MTKVVLDTNVIVSALLKAGGLEARVLKLVLGGHLTAYISTPILAEYRKVLKSPNLSLNPALVEDSLQGLETSSVMTSPRKTLAISPDEADNRFLECAEAAGADYLITGNKRHFPKTWGKTRVVNARELLELLAQNLIP